MLGGGKEVRLRDCLKLFPCNRHPDAAVALPEVIPITVLGVRYDSRLRCTVLHRADPR